MKNLITTVFSVCATSLLLTACGSDSVTDNSPLVTPNLNDTEISSLLFMREEEELARDLYLDIYEAKGSRLTTFKTISDNAETKHADAMLSLLTKYGIDDPSTGARNTYTSTELQDLYDSLLSDAIGSDDLAALRVGALVEEEDIFDINTHKDNISTEHTDIIATYDKLLCGSRNHLRAFVKEIELISGSTYVTQVPALDTEVRAILSTPQERCGN